MSGYTKGHWEVFPRKVATDDQFDIMPVAAKGMGWVTLPHQDPQGVGDYMQVGGGCNEATARLIAASPDLLEALQLADKWMGEFNRPPDLGDTIRAAIAKATGAEE